MSRFHACFDQRLRGLAGRLYAKGLGPLLDGLRVASTGTTVCCAITLPIDGAYPWFRRMIFTPRVVGQLRNPLLSGIGFPLAQI